MCSPTTDFVFRNTYIFKTGVAVLSHTILLYKSQNESSREMPYYILPGLGMCKIYSNSMLALLNSRVIIKGGRNAGDAFGSFEVWSTALQEREASLEEHAMNTIRNRNSPEE
jgi:hypothetical protein